MRIDGDYVFVTQEEYDSWTKNGVIINGLMSCGPYDVGEWERYDAEQGKAFTPAQRNYVRKKN